MKIKDCIDVFLSHNAEVALFERDKEDSHYSNKVWKGVAWQIPEEYLNREFYPISDYINIESGVIVHPIHFELKPLEEQSCL